MKTVAFSLWLAATTVANPLNYFQRRDTQPTCAGITAKTNNGNRKIAIVVDSSGSMSTNDPYDLRLAGAHKIVDWLIASNEASGGKKMDLVSIIDFASSATVDFNIGDPLNAGPAIDTIGSSGGTSIASGVRAGISQIEKGAGSTKDRSGIIVFTDGQVSVARSKLGSV